MECRWTLWPYEPISPIQQAKIGPISVHERPKGAIRVNMGPYLTLVDPYEEHKGYKALYGSEGGHLGPIGGLYRTK